MTTPLHPSGMQRTTQTLLIALALVTGFVAHSSPAQDYEQRGLDIHGEAGDWLGISVSLSSDGSVVAIGAPGNIYISPGGYVRIFAWNGLTWAQRGNDIEGEATDWLGVSVSLSSDGSVVAIGAPGDFFSGSPGYVRIYAWNGEAWVQRGIDLEGEREQEALGISVSLSADGGVVAIGGPFYNTGNTGHVRIYAWDGSAWIQRGSDINGEDIGDNFGESVSLSADGSVVAIGATGNDQAGWHAGHVRIYAWDGTTWTQTGGDIDGEAEEDHFGESVSLSSNGDVVAIGAPSVNARGPGYVRIYAWSGEAWVQRGIDFEGENADEGLGASVSLSANGSIVAIGTGRNHPSHVRIYAWDGSAWIQHGSDINGEDSQDESGASVSLSADGSMLAIGAWINDVVRVFQYGSSSVAIETLPGLDTPSAFEILHAYPNPFRVLTRVRVQLTRAQDVQLTVHDLLGRQVAMLNKGFLGPGVHEFDWDAIDMGGATFPSGIYIIRMEAAGQSVAKMVSLVR